MIRLVASASKKVPVPGVSFSSQSFLASAEVEVADATDPATLQARLRDLYRLLRESIEQEIAASQRMDQDTIAPGPAPPPAERNHGNHRNPRSLPVPQATAAQVKAILAISRCINLSRAALVTELDATYGVSNPDELSVRQASEVIEDLKRRQPVS